MEEYFLKHCLSAKIVEGEEGEERKTDRILSWEIYLNINFDLIYYYNLPSVMISIHCNTNDWDIISTDVRKYTL